MAQRSNDAAVRDANVSLKREECASGTGQMPKDAAVKVAQIKLSREECV